MDSLTMAIHQLDVKDSVVTNLLETQTAPQTGSETPTTTTTTTTVPRPPTTSTPTTSSSATVVMNVLETQTAPQTGSETPATPTPSSKPTKTKSNKRKPTGSLKNTALKPLRTATLPRPPTTPKMTYFCRDLKGKKHDIKELRKLRNKSVLKGMKFMKKFLRRNKYAALYDIGDDAPSIFFEIWYTSADSRIRAEGGAIARELLNKLERKMVKNDGGKPPDRDGFFAIMFLARIRNEMGDVVECDALLKRADASYKKNGFKDTDHLFDQPLDGIGTLGTDPWLGLLMNILIMEFNNILFPKRYPITWGMKEALACIKHLPLDGPGGEDFHCSLFLATHIIYALGAYQSIKTRESDCPWLYRYLRISMRHWMRQSWKLERQKKHNRSVMDQETDRLLKAAELKEEDGGVEGDDQNMGEGGEGIAKELPAQKEQPETSTAIENEKTANKPLPPLNNNFIYFEIDGVSEIVDTFRGCGLTSASDRLVCEGSLSLLRTQRKDGSWPYWTDHGDGSKDKDCSFYDVLHPTWVAVQGLRDRDFKLDRPASEKWRVWVTKIVKQVGFADEPDYDGNWFKQGQVYASKGEYVPPHLKKKKKKKVVVVPKKRRRRKQLKGLVKKA